MQTKLFFVSSKIFKNFSKICECKKKNEKKKEWSKDTTEKMLISSNKFLVTSIDLRGAEFIDA